MRGGSQACHTPAPNRRPPLKGAMGAVLASFADDAVAHQMAADTGGRVLRFSEIDLALLQQPCPTVGNDWILALEYSRMWQRACSRRGPQEQQKTRLPPATDSASRALRSITDSLCHKNATALGLADENDYFEKFQ